MSRKTGYSRKNLIPSSLRSSPRSSPRSASTPRSSPPSSLGHASSSADNDGFNDNSMRSVNSSNNSAAGSSGQERRYLADQIMISAHVGQYDAEVDDDGDGDGDEMQSLSPRNTIRKQVDVGNNSSSSSGLETLRAALGGFAIKDGELGGLKTDPNYDEDERQELSPKASSVGSDAGGTGGAGSLLHPEEARTGGTSSAGNARINSLLRCVCPFVGLADAARRQGPAIFWKLLPSILVTKAFWLSLLTLGLCDLATIVAVVDEDASTNYEYQNEFGDDYTDDTGDGALEMSTDETDAAAVAAASTADKDGDGVVKLSFGLWSYSTSPEDRSANDDDDVSFFQAEEDRITTCTYHMLHAEEGAVFFMDPIFRTARAFGVITVAVGGMAMVSLWMGVFGGSNAHRSNQQQRTKRPKSRGLKTTVTIALILCSAFEGLTLLIFQTGVCGNKRMERAYGQKYRDCEIAEGASSPITAIVFWFLTGIAMLKLPSDEADTSIGSSAGSASEFSPEDSVAYGTDEGRILDDFVSREESKRPWWKRIFSSSTSASTLLQQRAAERRRVNGYTTELHFDDAYDEDDDEGYESWRDNTLSLQMKEFS